MFDRLEDLLLRYEEIMNQLSEPDVANDTGRFRRLMKEQSDLAPIVEAYRNYKQAKQDMEDSLALLEEESDEEMRELAKEELNDAKAKISGLENELKMVSYQLTKGEQLEGILSRTFSEIENITDVHQMTNTQLKRIIQKIEVDKDGNVDIYLRLLGDLGLDETVLIRNNETQGHYRQGRKH